MGTSKGNIVIELNPAKAPVTVDNFLNYVESGFYPNKIFHRVEANLVVQGGGYTSDLQLATTSAAIKLESSNGLSNTRGTIGMARTSVADSATSQFYFNTVDNTAFDYSSTNAGYAVFGKVVAGLDVVDLIRVVPVSTQGGLSNVPVTPVFITSAKQTQ
nr:MULTISPECIES: peptidylprolyl isomerase [unclassified Undibacterium]